MFLFVKILMANLFTALISDIVADEFSIAYSALKPKTRPFKFGNLFCVDLKSK